jgi:hypothetical protein
MIPIDEYKIYNVKGLYIPPSSLEAGSTYGKWNTKVEEVRPQDLL